MADAAGAELARNPDDLISALKKITMDRRPMPRTSPATAHLFFSNPYKAAGFIEKMFSTHPPVEERVRQLEALKGSPAGPVTR
jgi:heat shock protein HtpX